jgi:hypothetical protein
MKTIQALRNFARYKTHAGYRWAAVMSSGELLCEKCVIASYRNIYRATRDGSPGVFTCEGLTHCGEQESGTVDDCADCGRNLWTIDAD